VEDEDERGEDAPVEGEGIPLGRRHAAPLGAQAPPLVPECRDEGLHLPDEKEGVDVAVGAGGLDGLYHPCSPLGGEGFVKGV